MYTDRSQLQGQHHRRTPLVRADLAVAGCLLGGLVLLALLVPVERQAAVPILPLRLFQNRSYSALLSAGFFFQVAALPVGIFLPLHFQYVLGHSATVSGLLLMPLLAGMTVGNRLTATAVLSAGHARPAQLISVGLLPPAQPASSP
ncbi:hypothetical protein [Streptomyces phaeochromogenes]